MTAAPGLPRRGLAAVLGLPLAVSGPVVALPAPEAPRHDPDAHLLRLLRTLQREEAAWLVEDDDALQNAASVRIDNILATVAMLRPRGSVGFAIKAFVVQGYGDVCQVGAFVEQSLLEDLMRPHADLFT